jgi:CO/xanthine dehydrogenase FAD-binding subunit
MVNEIIPSTKHEILSYISNHDTYLLAGGTDLMVQHKNWANLPALFNKDIVYIFNVTELNYIKEIDTNLHIGTCTPVSDIVQHKKCPKSLLEAINIMASPGIRNMATLGGNIVNASPAGDTLPVLYMLEALIKVESLNGIKLVPINEVITGPRKTMLKASEMITEIIIPLHNHTREEFHKVGGRKADAISKVSMAALIDIRNSKVVDFRVSFGAVGPIVRRNRNMEQKYIGLDLYNFAKESSNIIKDYQTIITPIDDQRSNKEYRNKVAQNLLQEFIDSI